MEFSRQEYWRRNLFPTPGFLPGPGNELASSASPALAGRFFTTEPPGKPNLPVFILNEGKLQYLPVTLRKNPHRDLQGLDHLALLPFLASYFIRCLTEIFVSFLLAPECLSSFLPQNLCRSTSFPPHFLFTWPQVSAQQSLSSRKCFLTFQTKVFPPDSLSLY